MIEIKEGEIWLNGERIIFPRDGNFDPASLMLGLDVDDNIAIARLSASGQILTSPSVAINNVSGSQDLSVAALSVTTDFGAVNKQINTIAIHITTSKVRNVNVYARDTDAGVDYTLFTAAGTSDTTFIITTQYKFGPDFEIKIEVSQGAGENGTAHYYVMEETI